MSKNWGTSPPPYDTPVEVRTASGWRFIAQLKRDASLTEDEKRCDQWQAEEGANYPRSWSDGACWDSNANGNMSDPVIGWRPVNMCGSDGKPCANPACAPGYCFPDSPARQGGRQ